MLLRLPSVMRETAHCRSSIYAAISEGRFPAPVRIGRRAVAWRQEDIEKWKKRLVSAGPVRRRPAASTTGQTGDTTQWSG